MSHLESSFDLDKESNRDNLIETILYNVEQYKIATNTGAILHHANSMWDNIQTLKANYPNQRFAQKNYDIVKKIFDELGDTRKIVSIIEKGDNQYKKRDLGDQYYSSAFEHYKSAIEIMINPEIWFAGDVPLQTFKRYITYLKKNDQIDRSKQH